MDNSNFFLKRFKIKKINKEVAKARNKPKPAVLAFDKNINQPQNKTKIIKNIEDLLFFSKS